MVRSGDWCTKYNPNIDAASSQKHTASLLDWISTLRDSRMKTDWLVDSRWLYNSSACGPYERAYEVEIEGEGRRVALTYLLHSTFECTGEEWYSSYPSVFTRTSLYQVSFILAAANVNALWKQEPLLFWEIDHRFGYLLYPSLQDAKRPPAIKSRKGTWRRYG